MNKLIMALALLLTPFFSQKSLATYVVEPESVSPKVEVEKTYSCFSGIAGDLGLQTSQAECMTLLVPIYEGHNSVENCTAGWYQTEAIGKVGVACKYVSNGNSHNGVAGTTKFSADTINKICPPDDYPNYVFPLDTDDDGEIDECWKDNPALEKCPMGNYKFKVGGECVPVQCGEAGTQKSIWASGNIYSNNAGTYCDGSCAHTVGGGQNNDGFSGNIGISAISTGASCGQGTDFWHNDGAGDECTTSDVGTGTNFVSCSGNSEQQDPTQTTTDLDEQKTDEQEFGELVPIEETCTTGDPSCEIRNLKEKLETENLEQKTLTKELHNKSIEAQAKASTKLINTINSATDRNAQGLQMVTAAVDGVSSGGGGGGDSDDGICDTEGNCSTSIEIKTEPSEGLTGFWVSEYEDGLQGVFDNKLVEIQSSEFYTFLDQFNPSVSAGAAPSYQMCFNIGSLGNFGCHSFNIDPRTFPAIRIFILVTAGFLCRRILFGG